MALITLIIQSTFCTNCGPEQFGMICALWNPQATDLWASELGRTLQRIDRDLGRQQVCLIVPIWKQTPKEVALKADWYFSLTHRAYLQNCLEILGWVDLGVFGKKCFDFFGLQETVSRNSYMTTGLYRYSLAQPAILPPAQHMRGTSKIGSFNLSISKIIFDK